MSKTTGGIPGQVQTRIERMWFTNKNLAGTAILSGTNYLQNGYNVCLDPVNTCHTDGTGTAQKGYGVTQPETRNLMMYAGVLTNIPPNFQGPGWVDVIVKSTGDIPVRVKADLSTASTTSVILTPVDQLWTLTTIGAVTAITVRGSAAVASTTGVNGTAGDSSGVTGGVLENVMVLPTCAV